MDGPLFSSGDDDIVVEFDDQAVAQRAAAHDAAHEPAHDADATVYLDSTPALDLIKRGGGDNGIDNDDDDVDENESGFMLSLPAHHQLVTGTSETFSPTNHTTDTAFSLSQTLLPPLPFQQLPASTSATTTTAEKPAAAAAGTTISTYAEKTAAGATITTTPTTTTPARESLSRFFPLSPPVTAHGDNMIVDPATNEFVFNHTHTGTVTNNLTSSSAMDEDDDARMVAAMTNTTMTSNKNGGNGTKKSKKKTNSPVKKKQKTTGGKKQNNDNGFDNNDNYNTTDDDDVDGTTADHFLGVRVAKYFPHFEQYFFGTVSNRFDPYFNRNGNGRMGRNRFLWRILYDDGDEEDFDWEDLQQGMKDAERLLSDNNKKNTSRKSSNKKNSRSSKGDRNKNETTTTETTTAPKKRVYKSRKKPSFPTFGCPSNGWPFDTTTTIHDAMVISNRNTVATAIWNNYKMMVNNKNDNSNQRQQHYGSNNSYHRHLHDFHTFGYHSYHYVRVAKIFYNKQVFFGNVIDIQKKSYDDGDRNDSNGSGDDDPTTTTTTTTTTTVDDKVDGNRQRSRQRFSYYLFTVRYDDGDSEDWDYNELIKGIQLCQQQLALSTSKLSASSSASGLSSSSSSTLLSRKMSSSFQSNPSSKKADPTTTTTINTTTIQDATNTANNMTNTLNTTNATITSTSNNDETTNSSIDSNNNNNNKNTVDSTSRIRKKAIMSLWDIYDMDPYGQTVIDLDVQLSFKFWEQPTSVGTASSPTQPKTPPRKKKSSSGSTPTPTKKLKIINNMNTYIPISNMECKSNIVKFYLFILERQHCWIRRQASKRNEQYSLNRIMEQQLVSSKTTPTKMTLKEPGESFSLEDDDNRYCTFWTNCNVFQDFFFCNNYRELDRGTQWFHSQILLYFEEEILGIQPTNTTNMEGGGGHESSLYHHGLITNKQQNENDDCSLLMVPSDDDDDVDGADEERKQQQGKDKGTNEGQNDNDNASSSAPTPTPVQSPSIMQWKRWFEIVLWASYCYRHVNRIESFCTYLWDDDDTDNDFINNDIRYDPTGQPVPPTAKFNGIPKIHEWPTFRKLVLETQQRSSDKKNYRSSKTTTMTNNNNSKSANGNAGSGGATTTTPPTKTKTTTEPIRFFTGAHQNCGYRRFLENMDKIYIQHYYSSQKHQQKQKGQNRQENNTDFSSTGGTTTPPSSGTVLSQIADVILEASKRNYCTRHKKYFKEKYLSTSMKISVDNNFSGTIDIAADDTTTMTMTIPIKSSVVETCVGAIEKLLPGCGKFLSWQVTCDLIESNCFPNDEMFSSSSFAEATSTSESTPSMSTSTPNKQPTSIFRKNDTDNDNKVKNQVPNNISKIRKKKKNNGIVIDYCNLGAGARAGIDEIFFPKVSSDGKMDEGQGDDNADDDDDDDEQTQRRNNRTKKKPPSKKRKVTKDENVGEKTPPPMNTIPVLKVPKSNNAYLEYVKWLVDYQHVIYPLLVPSSDSLEYITSSTNTTSSENNSMREKVSPYTWKLDFPKWNERPLSVKEIEHALCEFSKFQRIERYHYQKSSSSSSSSPVDAVSGDENEKESEATTPTTRRRTTRSSENNDTTKKGKRSSNDKYEKMTTTALATPSTAPPMTAQRVRKSRSSYLDRRLQQQICHHPQYHQRQRRQSDQQQQEAQQKSTTGGAVEGGTASTIQQNPFRRYYICDTCNQGYCEDSAKIGALSISTPTATTKTTSSSLLSSSEANTSTSPSASAPASTSDSPMVIDGKPASTGDVNNSNNYKGSDDKTNDENSNNNNMIMNDEGDDDKTDSLPPLSWICPRCVTLSNHCWASC